MDYFNLTYICIKHESTIFAMEPYFHFTLEHIIFSLAYQKKKIIDILLILVHCCVLFLPSGQHLNFDQAYVPRGLTYYDQRIRIDKNPIRTALNVCKQLISKRVRISIFYLIVNIFLKNGSQTAFFHSLFICVFFFCILHVHFKLNEALLQPVIWMMCMRKCILYISFPVQKKETNKINSKVKM